MTNVSQKWLDCVMVLTPFTRDYSLQISASEISRKIKVPQKTVHRKLELLVKANLLDYTREGKNKLYFLDFGKQTSLSLINMVETFKELKFKQDFPQIALLFDELSSHFILFGSYAKGLAKKESDIDLIIFGKKSAEISKIVKRYPFEVNIFYFTLEQLKKMLKRREHLVLEIMKDHILFGDKEKIIKLFKDYK